MISVSLHIGTTEAGPLSSSDDQPDRSIRLEESRKEPFIIASSIPVNHPPASLPSKPITQQDVSGQSSAPAHLPIGGKESQRLSEMAKASAELPATPASANVVEEPSIRPSSPAPLEQELQASLAMTTEDSPSWKPGADTASATSLPDLMPTKRSPDTAEDGQAGEAAPVKSVEEKPVAEETSESPPAVSPPLSPFKALRIAIKPKTESLQSPEPSQKSHEHGELSLE